MEKANDVLKKSFAYQIYNLSYVKVNQKHDFNNAKITI